MHTCKIDHSCSNMYISEINWEYQYSYDWVCIYEFVHILTSIECNNMLFDIYDISIQYRLMNVSISYL